MANDLMADAKLYQIPPVGAEMVPASIERNSLRLDTSLSAGAGRLCMSGMLRWCGVLLFCGVVGLWGTSVDANEKPPVVLKPAVPYAKLASAIQKKLLAGEVPVELERLKNAKGQDVAIAKAWIIIPTTPKKVFSILQDVAKRYEYMPRLNKSILMKRFGPYDVYVYQEMQILWTRIPLHLRLTMTPERKIAWRLIKEKGKKNGVKENFGAWEFEPLDGGQKTLLSYTLFTDSGMLIPAFIRDALVKGDLPTVLKNARKRVMSDGRWKK